MHQDIFQAVKGHLNIYNSMALKHLVIFIHLRLQKKATLTLQGKQANKLFIKKELNITEDIVILFSGQFIPRKGIDILLKGSTNLPENVGVYIVGGKPCLEYLSLVDELQLKNIHFIDFKTPIELSNYYQAADIYVLPTREDIWGLVINEAMAYGLPVITTTNCLSGTELIEMVRMVFSLSQMISLHLIHTL